MPRQSLYVIDLSRHERDALESLARRYTLPYFDVLRAKMILLAAEGCLNDEIAAALSVGRDVVSLWRKRFFYHRLPGLEERPRPGRPLGPPCTSWCRSRPSRVRLPATRASRTDIAHETQRTGLIATVSGKTGGGSPRMPSTRDSPTARGSFA